MADLFTIDASVFLNAYNDTEIGHRQSREFLDLVRRQGGTLVEPALVLVEVAASLARGSGDAQLAYAVAMEIAELAGLILVPLDERLAFQATRLAADLRPRGGDAVYGAVAQRFNAVLVTRDQQQLERLAPVVTANSPEEALAAMDR